MTADTARDMFKDDDLRTTDPEVAGLVVAEAERQRDSVRLIASENYVSRAVLEATGTMLTNKYSEGYAGKRYYEGQQVIDQVETLAIERAKALFGVEHANVQPYSGSPANLAVYLAFLQPGGARGDRFGVHQQVRRGLPGPPLLRRLRIRGHR